LARFQDEKIRSLIGYAAERSELIGRRLRERGIEPKHIGSRADLHRIPVLTREDLRERAEALTARGLARGEALANSTGGSTGSNVPFLVDRGCWRERDATDLRSWLFLGLKPGARAAVVWGSPMDASRAAQWRQKLRRLVDNRRFISAYRIGDDAIDPILDWLARSQPEVLMGYSSVLDRLARRAGHRGGLPGPRFVVSSAETLFPDQRDRIEKAWGAEVFNLYGCREFGLVAIECPRHRGLHLMDERVAVEIVPEANDGPGELLVTDLDNRATPFIRYQVGDLAEKGEMAPCPCGRGLSRLGAVLGRSFEVIRGPSGGAVGGTFWSLLLRTAVKGIDTFQVVQHELARLEILVTPRDVLDARARQDLTVLIREALGEEVRVEFTERDELETLPSGKHRFVVSMLEESRPGSSRSTAASAPDEPDSSGAGRPSRGETPGRED
jgi:phenylacetate-CoA ligase